MVELQLEYKDYKEFLHYLSLKLQVELKEGHLVFPPSFGEGYMQVIELPNGLQALISDIHFHTDVVFKREKSKEYFCVLHFNDVELRGPVQIVKNGKQTEEKSKRRAGIALSSSQSDANYTVPAKTKAKVISILLPEEWLKNNLNRFDELKTLSNFTSFGNSLTHPEPFDAQHRILFDEVFQTEADHPIQKMIIKNRIMLLLEHFLSKLFSNMKNMDDNVPKKMKPADLSKLMEIESLLVRDFNQPPPTIITLAAGAGMSVSKLKTAFKKVYGTGIYEYYQKNRMQKARSLLLTGQYTVKEVGLQLGYTNLSNFSLAFKKEFGILPSKI